MYRTTPSPVTVLDVSTCTQFEKNSSAEVKDDENTSMASVYTLCIYLCI